MTSELLFAFTLFAVAASFKPGPNNTMLLAAGLNFGFRRTLPHILGINIGFATLQLAVGFGLGGVFAAFPDLYNGLRWATAGYLLYLAWRIAQSGVTGTDEAARPITFLEAFAFQWINPKGVMMAVIAVALYVPLENFFQRRADHRPVVDHQFPRRL